MAKHMLPACFEIVFERIEIGHLRRAMLWDVAHPPSAHHGVHRRLRAKRCALLDVADEQLRVEFLELRLRAPTLHPVAPALKLALQVANHAYAHAANDVLLSMRSVASGGSIADAKMRVEMDQLSLQINWVSLEYPLLCRKRTLRHSVGTRRLSSSNQF